MEVAQIVLNQVITMFLLISVGIAATKKKVITKTTVRFLSGFLMKLVIPCVLIDAYQQSVTKEKALQLLLAFGLAVVFHLMAVAVSGIIYGKKRTEAGIKRLGVVYSNCGFMGFPILLILLGTEGVFIGTAFFATFNVFMWIHGIKTLQPEQKLNLTRIFLNPGTVATAIGLATFLLRVSYPEPVSEAIKLLGGLNTPLAMIVTGSLLAAESPAKIIKDKDVILSALVRNMVMPLLFIVILDLSGVADWMEGAWRVGLATVIAAACPTAATTVILPTSMSMDNTKGSKILAVSTLFSLVTLPFVTYIAYTLLGPDLY